MKRPHEQLDGLSLKTITDGMIEEITEEYGVNQSLLLSPLLILNT